MVKKIIKIISIIVIVIALIVAGYFIYAYASYYRLDDNLSIDIEGSAANRTIETSKTLRISSANLGFGAYSDDYSFFMDGGTQSWAFSKKAVHTNINGSMDNIASLGANIMLLQEIDVDATRTYHINEKNLITDNLSENGYDQVSYNWVQNYDSPFLFYPLTQPHGKSKSGLMTISQYTISSCIRRSLPIEETFSKFYDLDRCYAKNYIDTDNGKQLVVYNVHLSAYTTDPSTAENQVKMLNEDMLEEVAAGNYVIVGGDMNKDLLDDSSKYFSSESTVADNWASPFPTELLDEEFTLVAPFDEDNPVPSCRNADAPYSEDTFVLTIDGFIVSSNVEVVESKVLDTSFKYSDHNPVYMDFILE